MTLGCGAYGGNITSDNITPMHLINIKRLAYGIRPVDIARALEEYGYPGAKSMRPAPAPLPVAAERASLEDKIARFLEARGIKPAPEPTPAPASPAPAPSPAPPSVAPLEFISEVDVRSALIEGRKLPVGPGTLITPAARDLGNENSIFLRV
jgi:acetaldehyde dehydrogenase (acetylating)